MFFYWRFRMYDTNWNQKNSVISQLRKEGSYLKFASARLRNDLDVVATAVQNYGFALAYAGHAPRSNKPIVLEAVSRAGTALEYAAPELKADKDVVLTALQNDGRALEFADVSFKKDKETVALAVKNDGRALEFADSSLRQDREIVMSAVMKEGRAIRHADYRLFSDVEIMTAAVNSDPMALEYASDNIRENLEQVLEQKPTPHPSLTLPKFDFEKEKKGFLSDIRYEQGLPLREQRFNPKDAHPRVLDDIETMKEASKIDPGILNYASDRVKTHLTVTSFSEISNQTERQEKLERDDDDFER